MLRGAEAGAVVPVGVHPFHHFRHGPIVEDGAARVIAAEPFHAIRRLAHFLAVIEHERPAPYPVEDRRHRAAHFHADAFPTAAFPASRTSSWFSA